MTSKASYRYDLKNISRPLKTRQRVKMYDSLQVSPSRRSLSPHSPLNTISRQTRDSYLLRVTKETTINTDHQPNIQPIKKRSRRPVIDKAKFERIIGDVRCQDFSLPLVESANKRCHRANQPLPHQSKILNSKDLHKNRKNFQNLRFQKQVSREKVYNPEQQDRQFYRQKSVKKMLSLKSTQDSYNPQNNTIDYDNYPSISKGSKLHQALKKIRHFDHSPGHVYGDQIFKPSKVPQPYDIAQSNESFVKKSMSNPRGYNKFDLYRDQITTRFDRVDPNWGMEINYESIYTNPSKQHPTISFKKSINRKPFQEFNKYPIRQNMSLQIPDNRRQ